MGEQLIREMSGRYEEYLHDESSKTGTADYIAFPETQEDVQAIMRSIGSEAAERAAVQGARTGIRGEAVPNGGYIINLSRMNKITDSGFTEGGEPYITVGPGVSLDDLSAELVRRFKGRDFFWPPSPSEGSATIGGIAASGAFGMNIVGYGETYGHISSVAYVDSYGEINTLRGRDEVSSFLARRHPGCCITSITLILSKRPESVWGTAFFFKDDAEALACADELQGFRCEETAGDIRITVLEYMSGSAVGLIEESRETLPSIQAVPPVPDGTAAIIYAEAEGEDDACADAMMQIAFTAAEHGADPDEAWAFVGWTETAKFHAYRHAATEAAAQYMAAMHSGDSRLHLLSTDIRKEGTAFSEAASEYVRRNRDTGYRVLTCGCISVPIIRIMIISEDQDSFIQANNEILKWLKGQE